MARAGPLAIIDLRVRLPKECVFPASAAGFVHTATALARMEQKQDLAAATALLLLHHAPAAQQQAAGGGGRGGGGRAGARLLVPVSNRFRKRVSAANMPRSLAINEQKQLSGNNPPQQSSHDRRSSGGRVVSAHRHINCGSGCRHTRTCRAHAQRAAPCGPGTRMRQQTEAGSSPGVPGGLQAPMSSGSSSSGGV